jgi:nucleobase:cation symporter-1, NCS1 family
VKKKRLQLEDLYLPNGIYRYSNGWNWNAVGATVAGCALAWGGLVVPILKPLYSYAWFVGFLVSLGVYYVLEMRRVPAAVLSTSIVN